MDAFRNLSELKFIHYEILNASQALVSVDLKDSSYLYDSADNGFKGHSIAEICEMKGQYSEDYYHQMELKYTTQNGILTSEAFEMLIGSSSFVLIIWI